MFCKVRSKPRSVRMTEEKAKSLLYMACATAHFSFDKRQPPRLQSGSITTFVLKRRASRPRASRLQQRLSTLSRFECSMQSPLIKNESAVPRSLSIAAQSRRDGIFIDQRPPQWISQLRRSGTPRLFYCYSRRKMSLLPSWRFWLVVVSIDIRLLWSQAHCLQRYSLSEGKSNEPN